MRGKQGHTIHFSGGKVFSVDELYDRFYDELVLWADTILNDMGEAEDLVQDFFVRRGVWIRPFNRLVYVMPPYVSPREDVERLCAAMHDVLTLPGMLE